MLSILYFLSLAVIISALDINGKVLWNDVCNNSVSLGQAKVVLDSGRLQGSVTRDGGFLIPDVPVGVYILSVVSHDYSFDQLRIDVTESAEVPEVRPYVAGTPLNPPSSVMLPYPISLAPRSKHNYFIPPETFDILQMMSNPMMLLMVFGGGMMLAMPYLMKNMDPEALEEFKEQQARMAGLQNAVASGDFKSGLTALMAGPQDELPASPQGGSSAAKTLAPGNKGRPNNKKGRR